MKLMEKIKRIDLIDVFLWVAPVVVGILLAWCLVGNRPFGDGTDKTINSIEESTKVNERRADAVVDATHEREVTARVKAQKKAAALRDDELVSALDQLLADYRGNKAR